jgi:uncharacterized membrane protein
MMAFGLIFPLLVLGAIAYALGWRPQFFQSQTGQSGQTPAEILKSRFARGEIGREEYERILRDLES